MPDDAQLMRSIAAGDALALQRFSLSLGPRLFALACRLLGDRSLAEDALQELLIKVWQNAYKWQGNKGSAYTWSYKILTNICFDLLKKQKNHLSLDVVMLKEDEHLFQAVDGRLDAYYLSRFLKEIPQKQRLVLTLCVVEGFTYAEVGALMNLSAKAVENALRRVKQTLKEMIEKQEMKEAV